MSQPQGFENPNHLGVVCHLHKALYGLKQSSYVWNEKFSSFLQEFNFTATSADSCLYFSRLNSRIPRLLIMLFVDDGMVISKTLDQVAHILGTGYPEVYVGLHIVRDWERCIIHIDQELYILAKLQKFGFADSHPFVIPTDPASAAQLQATGALGTK